MALRDNIYVSERKVLRELLGLFKDSPCMWDANHDLFGNKMAKDQALDAMLNKYKELVEDANIDTLKKKIDIMRTSYRREHRKVMANENHKPTLWFYSLLSFLNEKTPIPHSLSEDDEKSACKIEELEHKPPTKRSKATEFLTETSDIEEPTYNLKSDEMAETDAFGQTLGHQLKGLGPMQKTIAEKLISDVIYFARLEKLTTKTRLINLNDDYL